MEKAYDDISGRDCAKLLNLVTISFILVGHNSQTKY
jgi:hypothetical protein